MESHEPRTDGAASPVAPLEVTTYKRPGAAQPAQAAREAGWLVMTSSSVPSRAEARRIRSRAPSFAPRRQRYLKVGPTWQPRAGASLETYHPWGNPLYPRIPKAPKLPSEFGGSSPASPSLAPQVFEEGGLDLDLELELVHGEPSIWPSVRRVWTWLRGSSR